MTQHEAIQEIHGRVRQCFTRHRFTTFGDAILWLHKTEYETQKLEAGEQGISKFSTDILWLISLFGPKEPVDYSVMATRKIPTLKPMAVIEDEEIASDPQKDPKTTRPRNKKTRSRRRF